MSNRSRLMTISGVCCAMFICTSNTLAQETFSGCGLLLIDVTGCNGFFPDSGEFEFGLVLQNTGEFGHFDHVYVSGIVVEPCVHVCSALACLQDNTIEPCPICGDGLIGGDEQCDDTNLEDGDGCTGACTVEDGFACTGEPSVCTVPAIPTVSQWGLGVSALLLLITGTIYLRRNVRFLNTKKQDGSEISLRTVRSTVSRTIQALVRTVVKITV